MKARKKANFELPCCIFPMGQIIFTKLIVYCTHGTYIRWSFGTHGARRKKQGLFCNINVKFATAVFLNTCLKKIKLPCSHYRCAPVSELQSNISTMFVPRCVQGGLTVPSCSSLEDKKNKKRDICKNIFPIIIVIKRYLSL